MTNQMVFVRPANEHEIEVAMIADPGDFRAEVNGMVRFAQPAELAIDLLLVEEGIRKPEPFGEEE